MTACAFSSAIGQEGGDSLGITPFDVVVDGERVDDVQFAAFVDHGLQRAAVAADADDVDHARSRPPAGSRRIWPAVCRPEERSTTVLPSRCAS